ncbi:hypothetical protein PCE1_000073 [Barthelona sp. PCE]
MFKKRKKRSRASKIAKENKITLTHDWNTEDKRKENNDAISSSLRLIDSYISDTTTQNPSKKDRNVERENLNVMHRELVFRIQQLREKAEISLSSRNEQVKCCNGLLTLFEELQQYPKLFFDCFQDNVDPDRKKFIVSRFQNYISRFSTFDNLFVDFAACLVSMMTGSSFSSTKKDTLVDIFPYLGGLSF